MCPSKHISVQQLALEEQSEIFADEEKFCHREYFKAHTKWMQYWGSLLSTDPITMG